jgi:hypothetical protein
MNSGYLFVMGLIAFLAAVGPLTFAAYLEYKEQDN